MKRIPRQLPLLLTFLPLLLAGCSDSTSTLVPYTTDELREQGKVVMLRVGYTEEDSYLYAHSRQRIQIATRMFSERLQWKNTPLTSVRINGTSLPLLPGMTSLTTPWTEISPERNPIELDLLLDSGRQLLRDIPRPTPPTITPMADTLTTGSVLTLDLQTMNDYHRITFMVLYQIGEDEFVFRENLEGPGQVSFEMPDLYEHGELRILVSSQVIDLDEVVVADSLEMTSISSWYSRLITLQPSP